MFDFKVTPDKTRVMELENGNKLNLTITDPYGFIHLSLEHGQLPTHLKDQQWTSWDLAEKAAHRYVAERQSVVAEIKNKEIGTAVKRA